MVKRLRGGERSLFQGKHKEGAGSSSPLSCPDRLGGVASKKKKRDSLHPQHHTVEDVHSETETKEAEVHRKGRGREERGGEGEVDFHDEDGGRRGRKRVKHSDAREEATDDPTRREEEASLLRKKRQAKSDSAIEKSTGSEDGGGENTKKATSPGVAMVDVGGGEEFHSCTAEGGRGKGGGSSVSSLPKEVSSNAVTDNRAVVSPRQATATAAVERSKSLRKVTDSVGQQNEEGEGSPAHPATAASVSAASDGGGGTHGEGDLEYKPKPFLCEACTWLPPKEKVRAEAKFPCFIPCPSPSSLKISSFRSSVNTSQMPLCIPRTDRSP